MFGKYSSKRAYYSAIKTEEETEPVSGLAPFDIKLGITHGETAACAYFLDLFEVRQAFQEGLNHFHEIFRPDGVDLISLLKAQTIIRKHGAEMEAIQQDRIESVHSFDPNVCIDQSDIIDGTMIIAQDATKIRHVDGEKTLEIKGNSKKISHCGFKDAKIGVIGTLSAVSRSGDPRTENMSYVAAIENTDDFARRMYAEIKRRTGKIKRKVFLGDGADWIWDRVEMLIDEGEEVICILDFYHAKERLTELAKLLFGEQTPQYCKARDKWVAKTYAGKIQSVLSHLSNILWRYNGEQLKAIETAIRYFEKRKDMMRYDVFRKLNLPIGSGSVESACGHVIGGRLKGGGMTWATVGADTMLAARCSFKSGRFYDDHRLVYTRWYEAHVA